MKSSKVAENLSQAASLIGCDVALLRMAKAKGCDAFMAGNRIDTVRAKKWIAEHADELKTEGDKLSLRDQKLNEEIRKLKIANDTKEKLVILRADVARRDSMLAERFKSTLYSKLVDEAPADMTNDVATNRALLRNIADRLLAEVATWQRST